MTQFQGLLLRFCNEALKADLTTNNGLGARCSPRRVKELDSMKFPLLKTFIRFAWKNTLTIFGRI